MIALTLHPFPKRTPPFRLKSVYFYYSTQLLFKDDEIECQHRLCLQQVVTQNMMRETQICVHKHGFVSITSTQELHIQQNVSSIEDRDHGD